MTRQLSHAPPPLLSFERVTKRYARGAEKRVVLEAISIDIHPGEVVTIYGQRGSGKTTLLRLACGLEEPDEGTVRFSGHAFSGESQAFLADRLSADIGLARRDGPKTRHLPVLEWVALPLGRRMGRRDALLRASRMLLELEVEEGDATHWGDLTDGGRALVSLAHALVREPQLLLADDPAHSLGMEERAKVLDLLKAQAHKKSIGVVITSRDLTDVGPGCRVASLSGGRLTEPRREMADLLPIRRRKPSRSTAAS